MSSSSYETAGRPTTVNAARPNNYPVVDTDTPNTDESGPSSIVIVWERVSVVDLENLADDNSRKWCSVVTVAK